MSRGVASASAMHRQAKSPHHGEVWATTGPWACSADLWSAVAQASGLHTRSKSDYLRQYLVSPDFGAHADWKSALQQTRGLRYAEGLRLPRLR